LFSFLDLSGDLAQIMLSRPFEKDHAGHSHPFEAFPDLDPQVDP